MSRYTAEEATYLVETRRQN